MANLITIDAAGKKLGRLASQVAYALRGKTSPSYTPNSMDLPKVVVKNADHISFSEKRLNESEFKRFSGYPSGLKLTKASDAAAKDKREILRHAISGMIHRNKLKSRMIKNLTIYHGDEK